MFALDLIDNPDELIALTFVRNLRKRGWQLQLRFSYYKVRILTVRFEKRRD